MILVIHIWNSVWIIWYISPSKQQRNIVQLCTISHLDHVLRLNIKGLKHNGIRGIVETTVDVRWGQLQASPTAGIFGGPLLHLNFFLLGLIAFFRELSLASLIKNMPKVLSKILKCSFRSSRILVYCFAQRSCWCINLRQEKSAGLLTVISA